MINNKVYILDFEMDLLPELWIKIISYLDCESILSLHLLSKDFYKLCKDNNLYIKNKFKRFPRCDGKAKLYEITKNLDDNTMIKLMHYKLTGKGEKIDLRNEYLKELSSKTSDVLRGDLIIVNIRISTTDEYSCFEILVFDGQKLLSLTTNLYYKGTLPQKFLIINDNVPINYWMLALDTVELVWFNISEIKKELINNITFNLKNKRLQTCYKNYYIEYIMDDIGYENISFDTTYLELIKLINDNNLLLLSLIDHENNVMKDNTLYLSKITPYYNKI